VQLQIIYYMQYVCCCVKEEVRQPSLWEVDGVAVADNDVVVTMVRNVVWMMRGG